MPKEGNSSLNEYQIKPKHREKFKPSEAREIIKAVLKDKLVPKQQAPPSDLNPTSKDIADSIKYKLKETGKDRYKYIVQVILGNQKGQGVQAGCRNFWDADTDGVAFEQYVDDNLFCLVTVWAVYVY